MTSQLTVNVKSSVQFHFDCNTCGNYGHFWLGPKRLKDGQIRADGTCDVCENAVAGFSDENHIIHKKADSYVRAILKFVKTVETSDDPRDYHAGPDYDLYELTVEHGPEKAFLTWFGRSMLWGLSLSRVSSTNQFVDFGFTIDIGIEGHTFDFTYDEFFPVWLRASTDEAKAEIANMASKAFSRIARASHVSDL